MTHHIIFDKLILGNNKGDNMILEKTKVEIETSADFKKQAFRIDPRQMNKMMWLTINQYEHKIRTSVQEVICNGRDAQRENGNADTPLKIVLPTKIEPTFKVRDYGVGISPERMTDVFTSFGASTKGNSNLQTGGFGIGAKSPLCYTGQFNVVTYIDGKFWAYVVSKNEDNGIDLIEIGKGETLEPNGTEVQIPVAMSDTKKFIEAACRATMFWDVQPNFNLPKEELYTVSGGLKINDTVNVYHSNEIDLLGSGVYLISDGIPYKIDNYTFKINAINAQVKYNSITTIKVNTGDVKLLQTRESIEDCPKSQEFIKGLNVRVTRDIENYRNSQVTSTNFIERYQQYNNISGVLNVSDHTYKKFKFTNGQRMLAFHESLDIAQYDYFKKHYRNSKKQTMNKNKLKKSWQGYYTLSGNLFDNIYVDDLGDKESEILKNRRIKLKLESTDYVYVLRQGIMKNAEFKVLCEQLEVKKLSTLPLPPKKPKAKSTKAKVPRDKEKFCVYRLRKNYVNVSKESSWTSLADFYKTPVIYVEMDSGKLTTRLGGNDIKYLEQLGYTVLGASKKSIKMIQGLSNTTNIVDYLNNWKPSKKEIGYYIYSNVRNDHNYQTTFLCENITKLKNKELTQLVNNVILYTGKGRTWIPIKFTAKMEKTHKKELAATKKAIADLKKKLDKDYGILKAVKFGYENDRLILNFLNKGL